MHGEQDGFVSRSGLTLMIIALMGIGLFYFEGFTILEIQKKKKMQFGTMPSLCTLSLEGGRDELDTHALNN